jgi:hypothetical protein
MQKCPKCGYNEGLDWPAVLMIVAFVLVSVAAGGSGASKRVQLSIAAGMFLFAASMFWRAARDDKNRVEYWKSHPPDRERPKII